MCTLYNLPCCLTIFNLLGVSTGLLITIFSQLVDINEEALARSTKNPLSTDVPVDLQNVVCTEYFQNADLLIHNCMRRFNVSDSREYH